MLLWLRPSCVRHLLARQDRRYNPADPYYRELGCGRTKKEGSCSPQQEPSQKRLTDLQVGYRKTGDPQP